MEPRMLDRNPWRVRFGLVALLAMLTFLGGCMGCGGDEELETDPTEFPGGAPPDDIEDVELPDDNLGGSPVDGGGVDVDEVTDPVPAIVLQDVFFDFDKSDIGPDGRDALAQNSRLLRDNPGVRVLIEGHCDERGTIQYNLALGERRALEVKDYLVSLGINGSRLDVVSYGKERPFVRGTGEAVWSQNRRAHFVVQR